jgi:predicted HD phosphohydrolase
MTNHPITPPPELVQQWIQQSTTTECTASQVATRAAQWGADQELEACCALMDDWGLEESDLRAARRPKPQTLNSIALQMLGTIERDDYYLPEITDIIRRALEAER